MRLQELRLENFKAFFGEHRVILPVAEPSRTVYLFGGLNGAGKTSLTQALVLALHGARAGGLPGLFRGGRDAKSQYATWLGSAFNHEARKTGVDQMSAAVTLVDGPSTLVVTRRWWFDASGGFLEEELDVREDTASATLRLTETDGQALVDEVIPRHLLDFAIFDGERVRRLDDTLSAGSVRSALDRLLNLDAVERTRVELSRLVRERQLDQADDGQRRAYETLCERLRVAESGRSELASELKAAENDHAKTQRDLDHLAMEFDHALSTSSTSDRLTADLVSLRERRAGLRSRLGRQLGDWLYLWPAFDMLPRLVDNVATQQDQRNGRERLKLELETVETLAERLGKDRALRRGVGTPALKELGRWMTTEIATRRRSVDEATLRGANTSLTQFSDTELEDVRAAAAGATRDIAEVHELAGDLLRVEHRIGELEELLQRADRDSATAQLLRRRDDLNVLLGEQRATTEQVRLNLEAQQTIVQEERTHLARIEQHLAVPDTDSNWIRTAEATIAALDAFLGESRAAASDAVRTRMLRNLTTLLRKKNLITDVLIDPVSHVTRLVGEGGVDVELPSAAEHQLAAMAFIDAVLAAADNPLPVFIDTPLARLDSHHRRAVVRDFWPSLGRQVVVLSTDEEVVDQLLTFAEPSLAGIFHIECTDGRSSVTPNSYVGEVAS